MALLKSFSTPGRGIGRSMGPNIEDRATAMLADAMPQARLPRRDLPGPYDVGGTREHLLMEHAPPEQQADFAARALQGRIDQQIGQTGVDLDEHAALRQAQVMAGNQSHGKAMGYARAPAMGTDDPRGTQQFRNQFQRAIQGLMPQRPPVMGGGPQ
jgi:hypothetical protein